jgi:hypothetical protein
MSFLSNYVLQYVGCAGIVSVAESSPDDYDSYYPGTKVLQMESLVRFALCPRGGDDASSSSTSRSSSCSAHSRGRCRTGGGGGGEYVVRMSTFLQAYTENLLTEEERTCEMVRRSCGCDDNNDETNCEPNCYAQNGHNECIEYQGQEAFHVQRYLQCTGTHTLLRCCCCCCCVVFGRAARRGSLRSPHSQKTLVARI